jgi:hypothetical protein
MKKNVWFVLMALVAFLSVGSDSCGDDDDSDHHAGDDDNGAGDNDAGDDDSGGGFACEGDVCADADTGLTWENGSDVCADHPVFDDATNYCVTLERGGYTDWRMPTISELRTLVLGCTATESGGSCGVTDDCTETDACQDSSCVGCSGDGPTNGCYWEAGLVGDCNAYYWSSTVVEQHPSDYWRVSYVAASIDSGGKYSSSCVRCVRP